MVSTLNELSHLKNSGFGRPRPPRHGLNLLYWFAHDYIDFSYNAEIVPRFRPQNGDFGFHQYYNRIVDEEDHIVPIQNLPYYEVGNLNYRGANKLPNYVRENHNLNRHTPGSNKDRIIVRLDAYGRVNRVYVTEHSDSKRFNSSKTFRVSQGLLQIIKNMRRDQYLSQLSYTPDIRGGLQSRDQHVSHFSSAPENHARSQSHYQTPSDNDSWCAIL